MPEAFPSCFGESGGAHLTDKSSSTAAASGCKITQNLITCLYQTKLAGICKFVTITWCKNLMGHGLSVHVNDPSCHYMCKVDMKPWSFWKKHGSKNFDVKGKKMDVFWDVSNAKYVCGPEPQEGFYVALICEEEIVLLLGDMQEEAYKKTHARMAFIEPTSLSRREHVFGKRYYTTKAQFGESGRTHDIVIECHTGGSKEPRLYVRVDKLVVLQVKHLMWKFRGNQTIEVDGTSIQIFRDVHNWLFNPTNGHAVFMFQTSGDWIPNNAQRSDNAVVVPCQPLPPSVLQWPPISEAMIRPSSRATPPPLPLQTQARQYCNGQAWRLKLVAHLASLCCCMHGRDKKGSAAPVNAQEMKRTRMDRGELENILFKLFERQSNWTLKQLVMETDQPQQFIKEILNDLGLYNKRGTNQGTYELKPEYKKSTEDMEAE